MLQKHCSRDLLHKDNIDGRCTIFNNIPEYADTDFAIVFAGADNQHGRRSFNQYFSGSNTDSGIHAYFCTEEIILMPWMLNVLISRTEEMFGYMTDIIH